MEDAENKKIFASKGIKNTRSRNLVYNVLKNSALPLTAQQIYLKLQETDTTINLSTVYRALEMFVRKELVLKSTLAEENKAVFELNRNQHQHYLVCIACREIFPLPACPLEEYEEQLHKEIGFDVTGHRFEIYGYCKNCRHHQH